MLENFTEDYQIKEFAIMAPFLTGFSDLPIEKINMGAEDWFPARGYTVIKPYQKGDITAAERHKVVEFFNEDETFAMKTKDLLDTLIIYKEDTVMGAGLSFAATLAVFEVCDVFFVMVTTIKVMKERRKKGLGTAFFRDIAEYLAKTTDGTAYKAAYMVVQ
jgi:GNAT superfamily N-acetyltransferase